MDEVRVVLLEAEKQMAAIRTLYDADLELQRVSPTLRAKIKGFLGNQRSALDHLAQSVVAAHGTGGAHTHYPFAGDAAAFEPSLEKNMPGVREQRPDVADAIAGHQPFTAPALASLRDLLNDESQQRLTPETREKPKDPETLAPPEMAVPATEVESTPAPAGPPPGAGGIMLSGGLFINGVEYDPITLKQQQEARRQESTVVYADWRFAGRDASALSTLEAISAAVGAAVGEVSATAGLAPQPD